MVKLKMVPAGEEVGAPKVNRASKKNKKSWRKNVDMTAVNQLLEERRFDERTGGSLAEQPDSALFTVDSGGGAGDQQAGRDRKTVRPLRCFANLAGLPGAQDPVGLRNTTKTPEQRENPIVTAQRERKIKAGRVSKKHQSRVQDRQTGLDKKEATKVERLTRRRTVFDRDLWAEQEEDKKSLPSLEWVGKEAVLQAALGTRGSSATAEFRPRATGSLASSGSRLPAVEVPGSGASYNPSLAEHQDLLWQAAMVEINKEKEQQRIERQTTGMFPSRAEAPTKQSELQEMSEGIVELAGEKKEEEEAAGEGEQEVVQVVVASSLRPKTRKQKRDRRKRLFEEQRRVREKEVKLKEVEVTRARALNKKLKAEEEITKEKSEKRVAAREEKLSGPMKLSNYNYEPQEIEIKLSDELTGNLKDIKQEGSLLEDRYKSLQRRNMIEVRQKQKPYKHLKRKTYEKRSYRMGWEENQNKVAKRIRQEAKQRKRQKAA